MKAENSPAPEASLQREESSEKTVEPSDSNDTDATSPPSEERSSKMRAGKAEFLRILGTKAFLIPLATAVVISILVWALPLERRFLGEQTPPVPPLGRVVYDVSSYLGYQHRVTFRLSAAYTRPEEKAALQQKFPTLKTVIANAGHLPEFQEAIQEQDLNALENAIILLLHDVTDLPVERLKISRLRLD